MKAMGKAAYWQRGETIDYINKTEETIEAGSVVSFGKRIGITGTDIAPGETGSLHVEGVFEVTKSGGAIEAGDEVYLDVAAMLAKMDAVAIPSANGIFNSTVQNGIRAGYAVQDADADAETVFVKINA